MASTVLYPPIVDSYMPAFIAGPTSSCDIYFSLSKFNGGLDITNGNYSAQAVIMKQSSGINIVNKDETNINNKCRKTGIILDIPIIRATGDNLYYITLHNEDIKSESEKYGWEIGTIYKVQIRISAIKFSNTENQGEAEWLANNPTEFSEWSTTCILKAIGKIDFNIPNYNYSTEDPQAGSLVKIDAEELHFVGDFKCLDKSEKLYSYRVKLYDDNNKITEDSGLLYSNKYYDVNQFGYNFKTEPINDTFYKVEIEYETINKYTGILNLPLIYIHFNELEMITTQLLSVENDVDDMVAKVSSIFEEEEEGRVILQLYDPDGYHTSDLMIRRADSRDNFKSWTDIKIMEPTEQYFYDYTIESGVWYKYGIQKHEKIGTQINRGVLNIINTPIMRNFNYSFLLGENNQQLKLQFDNEFSGYKINVSEGQSVTIGGQFPLITRNGATKYKSFSLGGLISFNMDENNLFLSKDQIYKFEEVKQLYEQYNQKMGITYHDYIYEKEFRNAVIDFLYNGKHKLFKSSTEGNMLVYLMDINLTPNNQLGNLIHSFSSSAVEVCKPTTENYIKYKILTI